MFGSSVKKRKFVVMDGSDKKFLNDIKGLVQMCTGKMCWWNKMKCRSLDRQHPTMKVITVKSNYEDFKYLRKVLTNEYPEQCVFDAPL